MTFTTRTVNRRLSIYTTLTVLHFLMDSMYLSASVALLLFLGLRAGATCDSPQYLEMGLTGMVKCKFGEDFFGVLWYNTTLSIKSNPIVYYRNSIKTGPGYESGEFDIHPKGSLIINRVSLDHEHIFTAAYFHSQEEQPIFYEVRVIVTVKPSIPYPVFENCGETNHNCFSTVDIPFVQCYVRDVRPGVTLHLRARHTDADRNITTDMLAIPKGKVFTSLVTTNDTFRHSSLLVMLVCKASSPPEVLDKNESFILVQNGNVDFSSEEATLKYTRNGSMLELNCTSNDVGFIVWKKVNSNKDTRNDLLMYSVFIGDQFKEEVTSYLSMGPRGSLIFRYVTVKHEGKYLCIYGDGKNDGVKVYDVKVFVHPDPPYPIISGCKHKHCVLKAEHEGNLSCKLQGIRPQVNIKWETFNGIDEDLISFENRQLIVKDNGETFDIILTSSYRVKTTTHGKITVGCGVSDSIESFNLTTKFDLLFLKATSSPTEQIPFSRVLIWTVPSGILVLIVVVVLIITRTKYTRKRRKSRNHQKGTNIEENQPMMLKTTSQYEARKHSSNPSSQCSTEVQSLEGKRETFRAEIIERYKELYNAVQPIPFLRDRIYRVDKIFVDRVIEFRCSPEGAEDQWRTLQSYTEIFNNPLLESPLLVLEGEPGYGKSTLTLQIICDWSSQNYSILKETDLPILLQLRNFGEKSSFFQSIKECLLPSDSTLGERDIRDIISNTKSVVIILDGYDEYPEKDKPTDIKNILTRNMVQNVRVLLTTRSSCLPKDISSLAQRLRMKGFDKRSQEEYISRAVVGHDKRDVELLLKRLQENTMFTGLCEVALFFVILAHMVHDNKDLLNIKSATKCVSLIIDGFHKHMQNKLKDEDVEKYESIVKNHTKLSKAAFEALNGTTQQIVWKRDDLRRMVGHKFYVAYVQSGILVEEESFNFENFKSNLNQTVRFYHVIFCEWYASQFLSNYASKPFSIQLSNIVKNMASSGYQYTFRFACGRDSSAADKLIKQLYKVEDGDILATLCILEKTGNIDNIRHTIHQLCVDGVIISRYQSLLLQRSSFELLQIAAKNNIPIEYVSLHNCLESVDNSIPAIMITSNLAFDSSIPVKELVINLSNRELTRDEAFDILEFSSQCPSLNDLRFSGCVPPRHFKYDFDSLRHITVKWRPSIGSPVYILNKQTGRWQNENDGKEPSVEDFKKMVAERAERAKTSTEEDYRKRIRERRRERSRKKDGE